MIFTILVIKLNKNNLTLLQKSFFEAVNKAKVIEGHFARKCFQSFLKMLR